MEGADRLQCCNADDENVIGQARLTATCSATMARIGVSEAHPAKTTPWSR
jgi:hypothetical protein